MARAQHDAFDPVREGARRAAQDAELLLRLQEARVARRRSSRIDLLLPAGLVNSETGRRALFVDPTLALIGDYLRRSRLLADISQDVLASVSGVSQPMISRIERARAPAVPLEKVVALTLPLGRLFPFGVCPHDHACAWQPYRPIVHDITDSHLFIERMLKVSGELDLRDATSDAFEVDALSFVQRE